MRKEIYLICMIGLLALFIYSVTAIPLVCEADYISSYQCKLDMNGWDVSQDKSQTVSEDVGIDYFEAIVEWK